LAGSETHVAQTGFKIYILLVVLRW